MDPATVARLRSELVDAAYMQVLREVGAPDGSGLASLPPAVQDKAQQAIADRVSEGCKSLYATVEYANQLVGMNACPEVHG